MTKFNLNPLRGFRDVVPPESEIVELIIDEFRRVAKSFGYRHLITPTVERFELFALKSGEEIRKSMYVFVDKGGREVALRPEVTPSVVRAYLNKLRVMPKPLRFYYVGNVFRYDEPQFGRFREFIQAGAEIIGGSAVYHDVELIEMLEELYDRIGLKERIYKVNNIAVLRALTVGTSMTEDDVQHFLHLLDKGMYDEAIELLRSRGGEKQAEFLIMLKSLDSSSDVEKSLSLVEDEKSKLKDFVDIGSEIERLKDYLDLLKELGVKFVLDLRFARGIAYYTSLIFEVLTPHIPVSIAGGGRYDNLTTVYGGEPTPMTGFAAGVERTALALLKAYDVSTRLKKPMVLVLCLSEKSEAYRKVYELSKLLRNSGFVAVLECINASNLEKMLSYASKFGFDFTVIVGDRELSKGVAVVKSMKEYIQMEVELGKVPEYIKSKVR